MEDLNCCSNDVHISPLTGEARASRDHACQAECVGQPTASRFAPVVGQQAGRWRGSGEATHHAVRMPKVQRAVVGVLRHGGATAQLGLALSHRLARARVLAPEGQQQRVRVRVRSIRTQKHTSTLAPCKSVCTLDC